jgi:HD-GYP domain-containing protein (c-di-GMP phosphodiesterase class II)
MIYVPIPVAMLDLGKPLPVDVWDPEGTLLLRRGQAILSEQQRDMLHAHQAAMTETDANAWQKSYERMIHRMLKNGADVDAIARAGMPSEIREADYAVGSEVRGNWLDIQEVLRGILYQGEAAMRPLDRLAGIETRARELLREDPDASLFMLFQALANSALGYCASHALLVAVVCELTAEKLGLSEATRLSLFRAALVMNIGMARLQDSLVRQSTNLNETQKVSINEHAKISFDILKNFGIADEDQLDIVHWHHDLDESQGLRRNIESRRILHMADGFVAKMAARKTRLAMSPLGAAKSLFLGAKEGSERLTSAMATAVGFFPPGTYVLLINDEKAVAVARGERANIPHVVSIANAGGMALAQYIYRDTANPHYAIRSPVNPQDIRVKVSLEKAQKAHAEGAAP